MENTASMMIPISAAEAVTGYSTQPEPRQRAVATRSSKNPYKTAAANEEGDAPRSKEQHTLKVVNSLATRTELTVESRIPEVEVYIARKEGDGKKNTSTDSSTNPIGNTNEYGISPQQAIYLQRREVAMAALERQILGFAFKVESSTSLKAAGPAGTHVTFQRADIGVEVGHRNFKKALLNHNIHVHPALVPVQGYGGRLKRQISQAEHNSVSRKEDNAFRQDLARMRRGHADLNDLSHTIMMAILDRSNVYFDKALDWSIDAYWESPDFPCRDTHCVMAGARPDLCVAFEGAGLIREEVVSKLGYLQDLMMPEKLFARVFPFLFVETVESSDEKEAGYKTLNCAGRALFNIWKFMQDEGDNESAELSRLFFDQVRVFSVIITMQEIWIRMHWAMYLPKRSELLIDEGCPLLIETANIVTLKASGFTLSRMQGCTNAILKYAVEELRPCLRRAVNFQLQQRKVTERQRRVDVLRQRLAAEVDGVTVVRGTDEPGVKKEGGGDSNDRRTRGAQKSSATDRGTKAVQPSGGTDRGTRGVQRSSVTRGVARGTKGSQISRTKSAVPSGVAHATTNQPKASQPGQQLSKKRRRVDKAENGERAKDTNTRIHPSTGERAVETIDLAGEPEMQQPEPKKRKTRRAVLTRVGHTQ